MKAQKILMYSLFLGLFGLQLGCSKSSTAPSEAAPRQQEETEDLSLTVANSEIDTGTNNMTFAAGGTPPYTFSVVAGIGTIDMETGLFTAGATPSEVEVLVEDSKGDQASAFFDVVAAEEEDDDDEEETEDNDAEARTIVYAANDSRLLHNVGALDTKGYWSIAPTAKSTVNYLVYGPFATDWGGGKGKVSFNLSIDNVTKDSQEVAILAVFDETLRTTVSWLRLKRSDFTTANTMQTFEFDMDLYGRDGDKMQLLVYWMNNSTMAVGDIKVELE